jgi:8-amino-7-oxononanoate synthase
MPSEGERMSDVADRLAELERLGRNRRLRLVSGPQGPTVLLDGKPVLLLCSNNYLGLADHPRVREAAAEAAMRWGAGAGASRLISGTMTVHRRLEERLASFERSQACLLFGSGYLANLGVISALAGPQDAVFSDELNHASIVDGCRLSRAEVIVYRHLDVEHLEWSMRRDRAGRNAQRRRLIVTDSVFSMDGDVAPLGAIVEIARAHGARVAVDEAHATGTVGPGGRGAIAEAGLIGEIDVTIGTLGKALGSYGAYICAEEEMVRYLINTARPLIFSTAPAPPAVAAALAALELLQERPHRVQRLRANARALRRALAAEGFAVADDDMPIVPLVVGDERAAMEMCQAAIEGGVFAQAIRPPTVPAGTSRLRLAAMASHTAADMVKAASVLGAAARKLSLDPAAIGRPPSQLSGSDQSIDDHGDGQAPPHEGRVRLPSVPFDLERSTEHPRAPAAAQPSAPFDGERELTVHERPDARLEQERERTVAEPQRVPFDHERDGEFARAA